jgi:hypothetical protein
VGRGSWGRSGPRPREGGVREGREGGGEGAFAKKSRSKFVSGGRFQNNKTDQQNLGHSPRALFVPNARVDGVHRLQLTASRSQ